jgi:hypothetical protein
LLPRHHKNIPMCMTKKAGCKHYNHLLNTHTHTQLQHRPGPLTLQAGQRLRRSQLLVQGGGKRWLTRACLSFAQCVEQVVGVRQNPPLLLISMGWSLQKETKGNVNPSCTAACRSFRYKASKARISVHISTFIHTYDTEMIMVWSASLSFGMRREKKLTSCLWSAGAYDTEEAAARAYDLASLKY